MPRRALAPLCGLAIALLAAGALLGAAQSRELIGGYPVWGTEDARGTVTQTPIPGTERRRVKVRYGPIRITPGQNINAMADRLPTIPGGGYVTSFSFDLVRSRDGSVPSVDEVHLHHALWRSGLAVFAGGEEKTRVRLPAGFGYHMTEASPWILNHMIHNLTARPEQVDLIWEMDVVPLESREAARMRPVSTMWMDVRAGDPYPVFDVRRGTGRGGLFRYPTDAKTPYPSRPLNRVTVPADGVLVFTGGHVHPGGLRTDLLLTRGRRTTRVFRSVARYYEPRGPVSWDLAMTVSPPDWKVQVRRGDVLEVRAGYDTKRSAWYEAMGIMASAYALGEGGIDPFSPALRRTGSVSHGRLPENINRGGAPTKLPDPRTLPDGPRLSSDARVTIEGFLMSQGDLNRGAGLQLPPVIAPGERLTFINRDAKSDIFHTITACKAPCNRSGGSAYPLADGPVQFDSGELGYGPQWTTAAANRAHWATPKTLPEGTYTYFCRLHPVMRGSFRVAAPAA